MRSSRILMASAAVSTMLAVLPATSLRAADAAMESMLLNPGQLTWGDAPPSLPKGAKLAVLYGDPTKSGLFAMRLQAPAGYQVPPHWHSNDESLTVISGTLYLVPGDKADPARAQALETGGFHFVPAKSRHSAFARTPTVVQIQGSGPFDIQYVNPQDQPDKATRP